MTFKAWFNNSQNELQAVGSTTARLDCLVLLEDETGKDRAWLLAHPEYEVPAAIIEKLDAKIARRAQHVPLAYIRGKAEFYGRELAVNEHTLVPRPETETMITLLKELVSTSQMKRITSDTSLGHAKLTIIDIGTGSGALAVSAKLELPEATVIATDIDGECLKIARANASNLRADVDLYPGDLLDAMPANRYFDTSILLCNLPYVPNDFHINTAATHEPKHAIFGGADGLDLYRRMFSQLTALPGQPHHILTESLPPQHTELAAIAKVAGYRLQTTDDFIQLFAFCG